jgi:hypothetical protein
MPREAAAPVFPIPQEGIGTEAFCKRQTPNEHRRVSYTQTLAAFLLSASPYTPGTACFWAFCLAERGKSSYAGIPPFDQNL